jgi:hypothetical protein
VPVGDILVRDSGCDIEHDNTALSIDVVSITESTKLLLTGGIPHVELEFAEVGIEPERAVIKQTGQLVYSSTTTYNKRKRARR